MQQPSQLQHWRVPDCQRPLKQGAPSWIDLNM